MIVDDSPRIPRPPTNTARASKRSQLEAEKAGHSISISWFDEVTQDRESSATIGGVPEPSSYRRLTKPKMRCSTYNTVSSLLREENRFPR